MRAIARLCVSADAYKGKAVSSVREIFDVGLSPGMRAFFFLWGISDALPSYMLTYAYGCSWRLRAVNRESVRTWRGQGVVTHRPLLLLWSSWGTTTWFVSVPCTGQKMHLITHTRTKKKKRHVRNHKNVEKKNNEKGKKDTCSDEPVTHVDAKPCVINKEISADWYRNKLITP